MTMRTVRYQKVCLSILVLDPDPDPSRMTGYSRYAHEYVLPEATRRGEECTAPKYVDTEAKTRIQIDQLQHKWVLLERNHTPSDSQSNPKTYDQ
jgi:hypothetical protein